MTKRSQYFNCEYLKPKRHRFHADRGSHLVECLRCLSAYQNDKFDILYGESYVGKNKGWILHVN